MAGNFIGIGRNNVGGLIQPQVRGIEEGYQWESVIMTLGRRIEVGTKETKIPIVSDFPETEFVMKTGTQATPIAGTYPEVDVPNAPDVGYKPTSPFGLDGQEVVLEKIATIVEFADCVLQDIPNAAALQAIVVRRAEGGIARRFDQAAVLGTNAPPSYGDGIVDEADAAGNTIEIPANATPLETLQLLNDAMSIIESERYRNTAIAASSSLFGTFRSAFTSGNGQILVTYDSITQAPTYAFFGIRIFNAMILDGTDTVAIMGDWDSVLWGMRNGYEIDWSNEATVAKADGTFDHFWQQDITGVRVYARIGYVVLRRNGPDTYPLVVINRAAGTEPESQGASLKMQRI